MFGDFFQRSVRERTDFAVLGERLIEFVVRENPAARSITLSVNHSRGLVATIPLRCPPGELTAFLLKKEKWVLAKLDYYSTFPKPGEQREIIEGSKARFLGVDYAVRVIEAQGRPKVELDEQKKEIVVRVPQASPRAARLALLRWYRAQAERVFAARARFFADEMGLKIGRIFIRSQKTRWGTASSQNNLGFNWRLVLAPLEIVDYVVVHELAHLRELNHSKDFWRIVARYCPDFKARRKWLRENERALAF